MDGLLLVDKPSGPTSHDIVARVRRLIGERRIGHTGTLDPLASGLLLLVLGRATRLASFLSIDDKSYDAQVRLGVATDTYDALGSPTGSYAGSMPAKAEIERALDAFRGTFLQQPPAYSAKKIGGQRSYKLARAARAAAGSRASPAPPALPAPVSVTAHAIDVTTCDGDVVTLRIDCSSGFYVRSLAHDFGQRLGIGAHLAALRRTRVGRFRVASALTVEQLERTPSAAGGALIPLSAMLSELASVTLTPEGTTHVLHGRDVRPEDTQQTGFGTWDWGFDQMGSGNRDSLPRIRLLDETGDLVALAQPVPRTRLLHPSIVLR